MRNPVSLLAAQPTARESLLSGQRRILKDIANGAPLSDVLETIVHVIEAQSDGLRCAILLADPARRELRFVAAPNIPQDYKTHIRQYLRIEPGMGSCGTAAFLRRPIYTNDTATDPLWEQCSDIATRNGLRAIWSTPILSGPTDVVGTFAMYYGEPRLPDPEHIQIIEMATELSRVAIQATRSSAMLRMIFEGAPQAIAVTDVEGVFIRANPAFERMFGRPSAELRGKKLAAFVHEEDRALQQSCMAELAAGSRDHFVAKARWVRTNGEVVWTHMTTTALYGPSDEPPSAITLVEDVSDCKRAEDALRAAARKLRALMRRTVDLQETERRTISRELHDRVGQTLTALRINTGIIHERLNKHYDAVIRERNEDSVELIETAFNCVRDVMYELRPPMLDDHGLVATLQWFAGQFQKRTQVAVEVRGSEYCRMDSAIELALFRIAQEALTNVARHAKAIRIEIEVSLHGGSVTLVIKDDGVGFERADGDPVEKAGYGLITMRERSDALGGKFTVTSKRGDGTKITVVIPLSRAEP